MRITELRWSSWSLWILALGSLAYLPSFDGIFVFDDLPWIVDNDDLEHLWPPWAAARGTARPLLFFTLAINFAISGLAPWSYHVVNVAIHLSTALLLYGSLRRTLQIEGIAKYLRRVHPRDLAGGTALLWVVHPLTSQAVTYVIQRGESLASLLYVLCFYALLRSVSIAEDGLRRQGAWWALIVLSWWAAMATKQIAVTLPVVLLLFDMLILTGIWRETWRKRRVLYLALGAPVVAVLSGLLLTNPARLVAQVRGDAEDFGRIDYLISQPGVILHYLQLVIWPRPLMMDHGWPVSDGPQWALLLFIFLILAGVVYGLVRRRRLMFVGVWFAGILAPTSSLVPLRDLLVEHRMYLPLVAPLFLLGWLGSTLPSTARRWVLALAVLALAATTFARNQDYHSELALFAGATEQTQNAKRFYNLQLEFVIDEGGVLDGPLLSLVETDDQLLPAARALQQGDATAALRLLADHETASAANLRGLALWVSGRHDEAAIEWAAATDIPAARVNLAVASWLAGNLQDAEQLLVEQIRSAQPQAHYNLGALLAAQGHLKQARVALERALQLRPTLPEAINNLGAVAEGLGDPPTAITYYDEALAAGHSTAKLNRGLLHVRQRHYREALSLLDQVIAQTGGIHPRAAGARALARYFIGDLPGAVEDLHQAAQGGVASAALNNNSGCVQMALGNLDLAYELFETALAKDRTQTAAHHNLGKLLVILGRPAEAVAHLRQASARRPHDVVLTANLREAQRLADR
jgi:tetratricopeptide (TPR) repeat protein